LPSLTKLSREASFVVAGLLVAAAVPTIAFALMTPPKVWLEHAFDVLGYMPFWYFFSALATTAIGLPLYLLLRALSLVRWWTSVVAGGLGGLLVPKLFRWQGPFELQRFMEFALIGVVAALAFWFVVSVGLRNRPE